MIGNYLIYFCNLLPDLQVSQLYIIFIYFGCLMILSFVLIFIKFNFLDETRESFFQFLLRFI